VLDRGPRHGDAPPDKGLDGGTHWGMTARSWCTRYQTGRIYDHKPSTRTALAAPNRRRIFSTSFHASRTHGRGGFDGGRCRWTRASSWGNCTGRRQTARSSTNPRPGGRQGSKAGYTSGVAGVDARRATPQIRGFRGEGGVGSIEASGCSRKRSRREFSVRAYYRSLIALGNTENSCPDLKLNRVRTPECLGII
jgi:hypothetical protein